MQANWMKHQAIKLWLEGWGTSADCFLHLLLHFLNAPKTGGGRGGGGRAWGRDLIVFVGPGVGHLTNLVLQWEGIFESFFARRGTDMGGMDLTADRDERDWDRTYVSPLPRFTRATLRSGKICHAFYTWASGYDDRATPSHVLMLINWLIDWLQSCIWRYFNYTFLGSSLGMDKNVQPGWEGIWRQIFEKCQIPMPWIPPPPPPPT